ncbi:Cytochrome b561 eukaryote [Penicillium atrosanguineum]|uniref:Cytochrome b561 eukaryote n=1 Tax=Penicillium atrosanguineum TaxID=1132637 RepID=A0A9W9PSN4_9EURO|nr:Cytochrome b561 eukaryote [Penicillium atrosanguineum]KAJ5308327.1 Cytochrome b561 eukaryote [Penicillium atrosanguineum]
MASATGIPQTDPTTIVEQESAPLLGRPGDATQRQGESIARNLISASSVQLLASSGLLLQIQAALILQPTTTPQQKLRGTRVHYSIQLVSIICFLAAFTVIEVNKGDHPHFASPHGILGLLTVIFIVLQALVGVVQFFLSATVLGSVENGKRIYKYHRWTGYILLLLESTTVVAATRTSYNLAVIGIPTWAVFIALLVTLSGIGARVKPHKLGL